MKHFNFILIVLMTIALSISSFARGGRSSGGSRSSSRSASKSTSSPGKLFSSKPKASRVSTKKSTFSKKKTVAQKKAISKNKMDKQVSKQLASKNKNASKKYGSKKNASAAYKKKLSSSNKYTSATAPKTRPKHVPQSTSVGGRNVNVTYNTFPGGGYGYGYMNPSTGLFMALAANQMMVNNTMLQSAGYGHYGANGAPVVIHNPNANVFYGTVTGIIVVVIIIVFAIFLG